MKVIDIVTNKFFTMNPNFRNITIAGNVIQLNIPKINPEEETECIYYWYDHLTRGSQSTINIETALENKDWENFSQYFYGKKSHRCTLPNEITVFYQEILLGHLELNKETFELITCSEYECG